MKIVILAAVMLAISGCASQPLPMRSGACSDNGFMPQDIPNECVRETCVNGKIVRIEDLALTAPTDDWAEEKFCLRHPVDCYRAYSIKTESKWDQNMADAGKYWDRKSLHNGLGDAARHAYLTCVFAEKFGADFARELGEAHELDSGYLIFSRKGESGNRCCEKVMDLFNNEIGITLASKPGTCEDKVLSSLSLLRYSICPKNMENRENSSSPGAAK